MIFSEFISKVNKYLKSVRVLKNYISFDMIFPETWSTNKKSPEGVEMMQNENNEGKIITSFVCENKSNLIDSLEKFMDTFIKSNIEREEKEKLFKTKVQELKSIFEKENLENLKGLKFDVEELTKLLENEQEEVSVGDAKTA